MKTLSRFLFLTALGSFLLAARFEVIVSATVAVGVFAIAIQDYSRRPKPLPLVPRVRRAAPVRFVPPPLNVEPHRLAA